MRIRGLEFQVRTGGPADGVPVVLLHGFPQHSGQWDGVTPLLHAAGARTVAPDQRGYSPGARPSSTSDYVMAECVADVVSILDELGIGQAHIVGHDWGAAAAWTFAGSHPDRTLTLTALSVPHPSAFSAALQNPDGDQRAKSEYMRFFAQTTTAAEALLANDAAIMRSMYAGSGMTDSQIEAYVAPMREPAALESALQWYAALDLGGTPVPPVTAPTTFIWGALDIAIGRTAAYACEPYVAGDYRFVELPQVGHWISDQVPELVAEEIIARL